MISDKGDSIVRRVIALHMRYSYNISYIVLYLRPTIIMIVTI